MKKLLLLTLFCLPFVTFSQTNIGCTDSTACNYNPQAIVDDGSCHFLFGCTNPIACNYDSTALCDDGSCLTNNGCTDSLACNYDPLSTCDDGSCTYEGCIYPTACNYDPLAGCDDGSCVYPDGCTNPVACNYDSTATCDDGSCILPDGCTDSTAVNYSASALCDDGSCLYGVAGCTDPLALNYDSSATFNNGSCSYPSANIFFSEYAEGSSNNKYFEVYNASNDTVDLSGYAYPSVSNAPAVVGQYEYWNTFDAGAVVAPGDVYIVAHPSADALILAEADETHYYLSNGDDGYALVHGDQNTYTVLDWLGDWNGDPGSGWSVAGVSNGTKDHTLVRKCSVSQGNTSWSASAGTNTMDSEWEVLPNNTWSNIGSHTSPCATVSGCTDSTATNYDPTATVDDGSCIYGVADCNGVVNGTSVIDSCGVCQLAYIYNFITHVPTFVANANILVPGLDYNPAQEMVVMPGDPGDPTWNSSCTGCTDVTACNYNSAATIDDGSCILPDGCTDSTAFNYNPSALCDDGSCIAAVYGCTDPTACNYYPGANVDDGSCEWTSCAGTCGSITGVNLTDVIHDRLVFNWDDMNSSTCVVDQIRIRYREVGTSSYSNKTMGAPVGNSAPCLNTSKLVLNLTASTQYEYDFKIWYQSGTVVNWHSGGTFTTADVCVNATNVTATPNSSTQTDFCWTNPAAHEFVRLKYRIDSAGTSFSNIGGFGVMAPANCKTKNGLTPGTDYRVMWRTWCNSTGGPYRSPVWDGPVLWTQPSSIRLEGGESIANLDVYPNPSRDIFNISFTSEIIQELEVRVLNVVGEEIIIENMQQFAGEYVRQVDLNSYSKGIYLLEIETNQGVINKKLILQ